ncbi:MAG TPA: hypothetical protein VF824_06540 [Thermoanaerobaculia bacterium]|jgi:hypothetical protein
MRGFALGLLCLSLAGCSVLPQTTKNQVRGTLPVVKPEKPRALSELHGHDDVHRARQIMAEHSSVEYYSDFSLGILEISDDGTINPSQKEQVFKMLDAETKPGGLLVVFVHGWHHGARTCDRDLCCFRTVLSKLKQTRTRAYGAEVAGQNVVGVYIGWRGESRQSKGLNLTTIWNRKDVAETLGRGSAKELLLEINERYWNSQDQLTMLSIGHSLGGALLFQAAKETLTGNVSDIEQQEVRSYRVARADCDREQALGGRVKARRMGFGDLVILVNPALEANEYRALDDDLYDRTKDGWTRDQLTKAALPYDKNVPYPDNQLPILVAIASVDDSAVGTIFPISRWFLSPVKPSIAYRKNERIGIGHYAPHVTHHLGYADPMTPEELKARDPRDEDRKNCDCPMLTAEPRVGGTRLDLQKASQSFGPGDKFTLSLTPQRQERGWDLNSPYYVIEAEPKIISEHSDIFNEYFVGFLAQFMDAYYTKYERLEKEHALDCRYELPSGTIVGGTAAAKR